MLPEPTFDRNKLKNAILRKLTRKIYLVKASFLPSVGDRGRSWPTHWRVRETLETQTPRAGLYELWLFLGSPWQLAF